MTLPEYITALKSHDWFYEQSDDHSVWTRGKKAAQLLRQAQQSLDPLGGLWNASAPKECRIFAS